MEVGWGGKREVERKCMESSEKRMLGFEEKRGKMKRIKE